MDLHIASWEWKILYDIIPKMVLLVFVLFIKTDGHRQSHRHRPGSGNGQQKDNDNDNDNE